MGHATFWCFWTFPATGFTKCCFSFPPFIASCYCSPAHPEDSSGWLGRTSHDSSYRAAASWQGWPSHYILSQKILRKVWWSQIPQIPLNCPLSALLGGINRATLQARKVCSSLTFTAIPTQLFIIFLFNWPMKRGFSARDVIEVVVWQLFLDRVKHCLVTCSPARNGRCIPHGATSSMSVWQRSRHCSLLCFIRGEDWQLFRHQSE